MLLFVFVIMLLGIAIVLFARGLLEPIREAAREIPARARGLLGVQTMADLQRQAAAEASRRALVSISARHLPNDILILLSPDDYGRVRSLSQEFCNGVIVLLQAAVRTGARESGLPFKLLGEPKVRLKADARIARGTVGLISSILEETEYMSAAGEGEPLLILDLDGERIPLRDAELLVGRAGNADIQVDSTGISREHAKLSCRGTTVVVRDLGGRNGTSINGVPVRTARARIGDRIGFGPQTAGTVRLSRGAQELSECSTAPLPSS
ncbi:MAG TPA: FHA domain-containing protein [Solirubrobacterales bacterium]|nr:FHA domain-containing protein [Solirubrobacterales bacterium]